MKQPLLHTTSKVLPEGITVCIGDVRACWTKSVCPVRPYSLFLYVGIRSKTGTNRHCAEE